MLYGNYNNKNLLEATFEWTPFSWKRISQVVCSILRARIPQYSVLWNPTFPERSFVVLVVGFDVVCKK